MIRNAKLQDVLGIKRLVNAYAAKKVLLPRTEHEINTHLRDFSVFESNGKVLGCCALQLWGNEIAEIRSLAVSKQHSNKGIGSQLVEVKKKEAKQLGIGKIFVLTCKPEFFEKLGFRQIDKAELPHKVWTDCVKCPRFLECNEKALVFDIE